MEPLQQNFCTDNSNSRWGAYIDQCNRMEDSDITTFIYLNKPQLMIPNFQQKCHDHAQD